VTLVGQDQGVVLLGAKNPGSSYTARLTVDSEGVSFVSMHLPLGVEILSGDSLTMTKCTSTSKPLDSITVAEGLVMEDSRVFGSNSWGMIC